MARSERKREIDRRRRRREKAQKDVKRQAILASQAEKMRQAKHAGEAPATA